MAASITVRETLDEHEEPELIMRQCRWSGGPPIAELCSAALLLSFFVILIRLAANSGRRLDHFLSVSLFTKFNKFFLSPCYIPCQRINHDCAMTAFFGSSQPELCITNSRY